MDKILSPFISFILTSALFYSLLFFLVDRPSLEFNYESFIEIDLSEAIVEENPDKVKKEQPIENNVVQEVEEENNEEEKEKTPGIEDKKIEEQVTVSKPKRTIENLFGDSNIKKVTKELTTHKYEVEKVNVEKASIDLEKVFKSSVVPKKTQASSSNKTKKSVTDIEIENRYLKLLHKMLLASWHTKPEDAGKRAQIVFNIARDGSFVYYFKQVSLDKDFKSRLQSSLESLKSRKLPPNDEVIKVTVNFIAKE